MADSLKSTYRLADKDILKESLVVFSHRILSRLLTKGKNEETLVIKSLPDLFLLANLASVLGV